MNIIAQNTELVKWIPQTIIQFTEFQIFAQIKKVNYVFYEQLQKACKMNHTSVTAALKLLGIGTANGTYWKNGSSPSSDIVIQLAELLGVSTDFLLLGSELTINSYDMTESEKKLLSDYRNLNSDGKSFINKQIEIAKDYFS